MSNVFGQALSAVESAVANRMFARASRACRATKQLFDDLQRKLNMIIGVLAPCG
jgi:hypothetical protein